MMSLHDLLTSLEGEIAARDIHPNEIIGISIDGGWDNAGREFSAGVHIEVEAWKRAGLIPVAESNRRADLGTHHFVSKEEASVSFNCLVWVREAGNEMVPEPFRSFLNGLCKAA